MDEIRIGVVGYSTQRFDEPEAVRMLREAYNSIDSQYARRSKRLVSGLSNLGIPALAYKEAISKGWKTRGIGCTRDFKYDLFPVDEKIIAGETREQESQLFLKSIDILVRIGGGKQSISETAEFKASGRPVFEYDLPAQQ